MLSILHLTFLLSAGGAEDRKSLRPLGGGRGEAVFCARRMLLSQQFGVKEFFPSFRLHGGITERNGFYFQPL